MTATATQPETLTCTADTAKLRETMRRLASIPGRSVKPILDCVRIVARDGALHLTATNLETEATATIIACEVHEPGAVCVDAKRFAAALNTVSEPTVNMTLASDNLRVSTDAATFDLTTMPAGDYPATRGGGDVCMTVDAEALIAALAKTLPSVAKDASRYAINAVSIHSFRERADVVATDGRRLSLVKLAAKLDRTGPLLIPTPAAKLIVAVCDGEVSVSADAGCIRFESDGWRVTSSVVEASFPPYRDIFPKSQGITATLDVAELKDALNIAKVMTSDDSKGVRFDFSRDGLKLSSRTPEQGTATVRCACTLDGDSIAIGMQPQYVLDALNACDGDRVTIGMDAPNKPALFSDGDSRCIVMPVNLQ